MGFTPFVDDLGFVVAMIICGAGFLTYTSIKAWLAIFRNDPKGLRSILKASAVPAGVIGGIMACIGLFIEMTWPFLLSDGMGSYDIFFGDVIMFFSMVFIVYAIVAYFGLKLEYAGLFSFIMGVTTCFYGLWGYTTLVSPGTLGLTKDPWDTFLMYGAFGMAAIFAFPATIAVDWFLDHPGSTFAPFRLVFRPGKATEEVAAADAVFRLPYTFYILTVWFPLFGFLAMLAGWFYMGEILPGHLTSAP